MKSTISIKLFKLLEIHCISVKTISLLIDIPDIFQKNLEIFGEAILFVTARAVTVTVHVAHFLMPCPQ